MELGELIFDTFNILSDVRDGKPRESNESLAPDNNIVDPYTLVSQFIAQPVRVVITFAPGRGQFPWSPYALSSRSLRFA